jgi:transcriptional regulator with XRE-family HTH domain
VPRTATTDITQRVVGDAIRRARVDAGLTQAELARRITVSPAYITNVEAGRTNLTVGQLGNIAGALGAKIELRLERADVPALTVPAP